MTDLLKSKSKIQAVVKERIKYEPLSFEQRVRNEKDQLRNVVIKRPMPPSKLDDSQWGGKGNDPNEKKNE